MVRQINEYHPIIGHRYIPGIQARIPHESGGYLVQTNSSGFRCKHEFVKEKPDKSFRVLLFGDSFTAGDGVSNKYRFGDLLEQRVSGLQVLNFGLPGTGTDQQYLAFEHYAHDVTYDLLLICPLVQNIKRVASRYEMVITRENGDVGFMAKPYFELQNGELALRNTPVAKGIFERGDLESGDNSQVSQGTAERILRGFVNRYMYSVKNLLQKTVSYDPVAEYSDSNGREWVLMKSILTHWARRANGIPVVICPIPLYQHVEELSSPVNYQGRFAELSDEPNVRIHDPLYRFWEESIETRRRCRFEVDQHFTQLGHSIMADALMSVIVEAMKVREK